MLQDIYYIITPDAIKQPVKNLAGASIALKVDTSGNMDNRLFQVAELYLPNNPFCLLLQLRKPLQADQANSIIAFFFFQNYIKSNGIPQLIVDGESDVVKRGLEILQQSAKAQGFSAIQVIEHKVIHTTDTIKEVFKSSLHSADTSPAALYINVSQPEELENINQTLETEENLFAQQETGLFKLKKQNRELQKQLQQLERLCLAAQQEISNQQSHNQILRSDSHATILQNYYNNEYEVLPLWYKRLGHIIKVITGKRSFKSLYSDNAKKYRN